MLKTLRHLWLGVTLIAAASAILLVSDLDRRDKTRGAATPAVTRMPRVAILQFASTSLLDDVVAGMKDGLREAGYEDGRTVQLKCFNASGDYATATTMARDIVSGDYDLILTASTPGLQVMAAANKEGKTVHVFGAVTDPYGSGVAIEGPEPTQHPAHLVGVGTFQPVEAAFETAAALCPTLKTVGTVWNNGEHNSEACVLKARAICRKLGITLIEASAGNTSEVPEAVRSVLARGVDAVWIGGDTVAMSSINAILSAAAAAKVPVFSNDPTDSAKGAMFGLGASYPQVGKACGKMAAEILGGADPRTYRVDNLAPEVLAINEELAGKFTPRWALTDEIRQKARASAARVQAAKAAATAAKPQPGRTYKVGILFFSPDPIFERAMVGVAEALAESGFVEGKNLDLRRIHPNGDMSMLAQVTRNLADSDLDLLIPMSTPCLASVAANVKKMPVVFGIVGYPIEAGAGTAFDKHLPNITGAVWSSPHRPNFQWLKKIYPDCRTVGVIYNAAEANSRAELERARTMLTEVGIELTTRTIANSSEITQAIQSLLAAKVDAVFGMADNTVVSSYSALVDACRKHHVPVIADDSSLMGTGSLWSVGASPYREGRRTGFMAVKVLLGANPAHMPFEPCNEVGTAVDLGAAKRMGLALPPAMLQEADTFLHLRDQLGRPARVAMICVADNPSLNAAQAGVVRGLTDAGMQEGQDFVLDRLNAQGDMAQLSQLIDAAKTRNPDLIVTVSTPVLIAAARRIDDIPIVFTVASDPRKLGLFEKSVPANITGVHDDPPVDKLLDMAKQHDAALATVGIVYDPAQPNSRISVEKLRTACKSRHVALVEATASTVSDLPAAVQSLVQQKARAILLSADNLTTTGFPALVQAARAADVPIFATEPALVAQGATGAIGDDYDAWGAQTGLLAARVLAGVKPAALPIQVTSVQRTIEPKAPAAPAPAPVRAAARPAKPWELRIVLYNDAHSIEEGRDGLLHGLKQKGLVEGRDFNVRILNAQGDMATLASIMTAVRSEQPDLLLAVSTPVLQAALRQAAGQPTVFTGVADAVRAGAGKSETDHLPHVTGITVRSPFEGMARLLRSVMPEARRVGTLFTPSEINSVLYKDWLAQALKQEGIELVVVPVTSSAEMSDACDALLRQDIQAVCQVADNTTRPGFGHLAKKAAAARIPVFTFDSKQVQEGAALGLARDYFDAAVEASDVAIRVLRGEKPADIPFANTRTEQLLANPAVLERLGLRLPPDLDAKARKIP